MPDVLSRIRIEATGGDQAAREVGKVKKAFDETAESARGVSRVAVGAAADPFQQAVTRGALATDPGEVATREQRRGGELEKVRQREGEHRAGGLSQRMVGGGVSGISAVSRGDPLGAGQAGLQTGAGMAMAGGLMKLVPWLLGGAVALGGAKALAQAEWGRLQGLYETGLAQQTGQTYTALRNYQVQFGAETGAPPLSMIQAFTRGVTGGGLFGREGGEFETFAPQMRAMARQAERWGIDPTGMGQFMARGTQFGLQQGGTTTLLSNEIVGQLVTAFGHGRVTEAVRGLSSIMEKSLSEGVRAGFQDPEWLQGVTRDIAQYAVQGGFNMEGAMGLYSKMHERAGRMTTEVTGPADVMAIRAFRKPGESLFQTQLRGFQDRKAFKQTEFEAVRSMFGGDPDMMSRYFMRMGGLSPQQAWTYVQTGLAPGIAEPALIPPVSEFGQKAYGTRQQAFLEGLERGAIELMIGITGFMKSLKDTLEGKVAPETPAAKEERLRTEIKDKQLMDFIYGAGGTSAPATVEANEKRDRTNTLLESIDGKLDYGNPRGQPQ